MPSRVYNSDDDDGNLPLHRSAVAKKPQVAPPPPLPPPTWSAPRRSYPTGSSYHQTILGKALFEHGDCAMVVSVAASSSSIQNSSLGPNLFRLIVSTSPQVLSLFSNLFFISLATTLQFVNTLRLKAPSQELLNVISPLLTNTKYFTKSLRELNLEGQAINILSAFSSHSSSSPSSLQLFSADCCSFTDEHCRMVISSFPNLTQLNLRMCNLGDSTLKVFAQSAQRLPHLTSFSISFNDQVSDDGIKAITDNSSNFPNLTSLHFEGCDLLTDVSVEVLASTSLGNLQEVGFAGASGVTDESLRFLLKTGGSGSNTITKLNLSGCGITNDGLKYFSPCVDAADSAGGNCLARLKELRLSSCYEISDEGIKSLAASPFLIEANLTLLDISFCQNITDEGVDAITLSLTNLKELFLNRCTKVTGDKKMELKTSKPFLKLHC